MVDDEQFEDGQARERVVEEVVVTEAALRQRIIVPRAWGGATLLASTERGNVLLYTFAEMPHLLCWRLPDDEDVLVEILLDDDPRITEPLPTASEDDEDDEDDDDGEEAEPALAIWVLPDDIDEERLLYPVRWGQPTPIVDAWLDGGPLLLAFADGEHTLRWELAEDMLLSLVADDRRA